MVISTDYAINIVCESTLYKYCLAEGNVISSVANPTTFRAGEVVWIGSHQVSIGTSLNKDAVFKYTHKLLELCEEANDVFVLNSSSDSTDISESAPAGSVQDMPNEPTSAENVPAAAVTEEYKLIMSKDANPTYCAIVKIANGKFTLLKGSRIKNNYSPSTPGSCVKLREEFCQADQNGNLIVSKNVERNAPSIITGAVKGLSDNGRKTLSEADTVSKSELGKYLDTY